CDRSGGQRPRADGDSGRDVDQSRVFLCNGPPLRQAVPIDDSAAPELEDRQSDRRDGRSRPVLDGSRFGLPFTLRCIAVSVHEAVRPEVSDALPAWKSLPSAATSVCLRPPAASHGQFGALGHGLRDTLEMLPKWPSGATRPGPRSTKLYPC